jgi:predicted  nucleic acid-binding Zn-ribbon protein
MKMELDKEVMINERRANPPEYKCTKLDTFQSIAVTLQRIESKVDDLSDEMRTMIKLEQQVLTQSKDIERLNKQLDDLQHQNKALSDRILELRSNFESQKQSISVYERIGWAVATCVAIVIGKQLGIS